MYSYSNAIGYIVQLNDRLETKDANIGTRDSKVNSTNMGTIEVLVLIQHLLIPFVGLDDTRKGRGCQNWSSRLRSKPDQTNLSKSLWQKLRKRKNKQSYN